jgi:hypothetical protein
MDTDLDLLDTTLMIEPAYFCQTGSPLLDGLRREFKCDAVCFDCGQLDAPRYVPTGSLRVTPLGPDRFYAVTSGARDA